MSAPMPDDDKAAEVDEIRNILLSPDALIERISLVISEILEQKIAQSRDELAKAFAPIISEGIRYQVYEAKADIVDALYPVIGQAINKAVTEAVRNLAHNIDVRLRQSTNFGNVARRMQAGFRGIPAAEYELREALPFSVQEVFLIHKESGLLIQHFSRDEEAQADRDLVSGMLTAIRDFAREAFGRGQSGELGAIEYESSNILLEAGGVAYLAVVLDGVEPPGFRPQMRQALVALHEKNYEGLKNFDGTDEKLEERTFEVISKTFQSAASSREESAPPTSRQRLIIVALASTFVLFLCTPFVVCTVLGVLWISRVEQAIASMNQMPPPIVVTATPTETPLLTPTIRPTATPVPPTATPLPPSPTIFMQYPTETHTPVVVVATPTGRPEIGGVVNARILNLRASPTLASDVQLVLSYGDLVTGVARTEDGTWVYIYTWAGIAGWAYSPYIQWEGEVEHLLVDLEPQ